MDILGMWELVSMAGLDTETFETKWMTNEELGRLPDDDYQKMMHGSTFTFDEGGKLNVFCKLNVPADTTQEEIDEALNSGEVFKEGDDYFTVRPMAWKEEGGVIKVDSGERGEVFGEAIDPWKEVKVLGNTLIINDQYQIVKIGETPTEVKKTVKEVREVSEELKAAAGTYELVYSKFVGDPDTAKNDKDAFKLVLNDDGTGMSYRDDLEIKVPFWNVEGGAFELTEKFFGEIGYTGTLSGSELKLYNGDPEAEITCCYVFKKA